jgi:uncharacterized damage-inducible protein DinB
MSVSEEAAAFDIQQTLRSQWEGNRRLTLRVARAFPDDQLCRFAPTAQLRPFSAMLDEIARIELAYWRGLAEDRWQWDPQDPPPPESAVAARAFLEDATAYTQKAWDAVTPAMLLRPRKDPFFWGDDHRPYDWLVYCIENEIHHRGQGYIYLRELGIEPPAFWER